MFGGLRKIFTTAGIVVLTLAANVYAGIEWGAGCSTTATKSFAYIDPGVGSMLFQVLIAGLVASGFVIKIFWVRIKSFFSRLFAKGAKKESDGNK